MSSYKAAMIGCGPRGDAHALALKSVRTFEFVATCDLNRQRAEEAARKFGAAKSYTDFRQMMQEAKPDILAIVTAPGVRTSLIMPLLEYGLKAIVLEKPMALTLPDAEKIVNACDAAGTRLVVCHQSPYSVEMQKLREMVESGRFGKVQKIVANCKMNMMAQGTHLIDLIGFMLTGNEPRWVLGQVDGTSELFKKPSERFWHSPHAVHPSTDHAIVQIGYGDGVCAFASIGNRSPDVPDCFDYTQEFQIAVIGEKGYGEATLAKGWRAFFSDGTADSGGSRPYDVDSYMTIALLQELVDVLEGKRAEHRTSGNAALKVQRILSCVEESVIQNRAIQLPYWPAPGTLARIRNRMAAQRPLVVATLEFPNTPRHEMFQALANTGFSDVDLWMNPPWAEHFKVGEDVGELKRELASFGLLVPMISYYAQPPVDKKLRITKELGARVAVTGGINLRRRPEKLADLKKELDLAYELDIKISYENHYGELETIEDMVYFLEALDHHPAASIALAPTHLSLFGQTPEDALHELKGAVTVCYLWDVDSSITPTEADLSKKDNWWENGMAQTPGGSDIDFGSYLTAADRYAPEAILNLNWHGTYHWDLPRIMASLIQARHIIDRNRHLNVDSVFHRHVR